MSDPDFVAELTTDLKPLSQHFPGLGVLPQRTVDQPQVVQGRGNASPITNLPANGQTFLAALLRFQKRPLPVRHLAPMVEHVGGPPGILSLPVDDQAFLKIFLCLGILPPHVGQIAQAVQR